jgi:hypothetical protein
MIDSPYKPEEIATREIGDVMYFFTAASPMSNHFKCNYVVKGTNYNCLEQYMMTQKAIMANDSDARERIMNSDDPVEMMKIAGNMTTLDVAQWETRCFDLMRPAAYAKFSQNISLKAKLLASGTKVLAEASLDPMWAIGIKLDDPDLGTKTWKGENRLGDLLMQTRTELARI